MDNLYIKQYINDVDINNIEYFKFNNKEMRKFLRKYYYDDYYERFVCDRVYDHYSPIGMYYLDIKEDKDRNASYIVGCSKNNIGGYTILNCMIFNENYKFSIRSKSVTYISTIETNSYFRNMGLLSDLISNSLKFIKKDQDVVVTSESSLGIRARVIEHIINIYKDNDFKNNITNELKLTDEYIKSLRK